MGDNECHIDRYFHTDLAHAETQEAEVKARVIFKFNWKIRVKTIDGRVYALERDAAQFLNPALQWGDMGELVFDKARNKMRFIVDAVESSLTPKPPADIITPSN